MRRLLLAALVLLTITAAHAQTPGDCSLGTAQGDLATPDLFARVYNTGSLFFGNTTTAGDGYFVPRALELSPVFAAGLWVGGRVGGEVRVAGSRYENFNFWPGPLDDGATLPNPASCAAFDRIYVTSPGDLAVYEATGTPTADLAGWPVGLGAPSVDAGGQPVAITSREQTLNLAAGERPVLHGGPTAYWVMNDVGNDHGPTNTAPLGIEVQVTAFAVDGGAGGAPVALRQSTVYRYRIVNRSSQPIEAMRTSVFVDSDLGNAVDDYIGADTTRGLAFTYNADDDDDGSTGYGVPPSFGLDALGGSWATSYLEGSASGPTTDPSNGEEIYFYQQGLWRDGTPMREGGNGYGPQTGPITRHAFPGDPLTQSYWSEVNYNGTGGTNPAGDRRMILSAPPTTLAPGASTTFDVAVLFGWGADRFDSIALVRQTSDAVQALYDDDLLFSAAPVPPAAVGTPTLVAPADGAAVTTDVAFEWDAVPGSDRYVLEVSSSPAFEAAEIAVVDGTSFTYPLSRFQPNLISPTYWRVRAGLAGREGTPSAVRQFAPRRYVAGATVLASGARAFVETTAPGGAPACDGPGDPDEGCAEVGGDLVANSPNSTDDYLVVFPGTRTPGRTETALATLDGREIEMRFTPAGGFAFVTLTTSPNGLTRVPFEVWDLGIVAPGQTNDPTDDRQLVPFLRKFRPIGQPCPFSYGMGTVEGVGPSTQPVSARYLVADDYAGFASAAAAAVDADPVGCPAASALAEAFAFVDTARPLALHNVALEQASARTVGELTGTTIRFYTADPIVAGEAAPDANALTLGAPYPNPTAGTATVPYRLATAGAVRLRVVDHLGRTVAVLADREVAAGTHEARLDTRALAAGVYAVVLDAGDERAVRRLTVVR